jgi:hypothetical protein
MDRPICGVFRRGETGSNEVLPALEDLYDPPSRLIFHEQDGAGRPFPLLFRARPVIMMGPMSILQKSTENP